LTAGGQHDSGHQLITEAAGKPPNAAEVLKSDSFGGLHLAGDHVARC
jgi:hypothetical protein